MRFGPHNTPVPVAFAACCAGVGIFSVMDAVMKGLSLSIGAYNALLWRGVAGLAIGGVAMLFARTARPTPAVLRLHMLRGVVVAFMALTFFWALTKLPMAEAIALSFVAPLIALYLAAILLGERVGPQAVWASVLGLCGVGVIMAARIAGSHEGDALLGVVAVLGSAALYAWNLVLQRQQAQLSSPVEIAFYQNLVIFLVMALEAPWYGVIPSTADAPLAVGAAALAFISLLFLSWAYARAEAQILIPVEYSAFIWSAIVGWLAFDERLEMTTLAGAALIVAGCLIATRAKPQSAAHVEAGQA
ncbi:MAG: DMT family transporter [Sphingobium sp.]|nr:DMT family transporter [Sphingobium sp.]